MRFPCISRVSKMMWIATHPHPHPPRAPPLAPRVEPRQPPMEGLSLLLLVDKQCSRRRKAKWQHRKPTQRRRKILDRILLLLPLALSLELLVSVLWWELSSFYGGLGSVPTCPSSIATTISTALAPSPCLKAPCLIPGLTVTSWPSGARAMAASMMIKTSPVEFCR